MKWIKRLLYGIIIFITLALAAILFLRENLPEGVKGKSAEALADQVLESIDTEAFKEIPWLQFSFRGGHDYLWDKQENMAIIKWDNNRVHLNLNNLVGQAWKNNQLVHGNEKEKLKEKAWAFWCNDSFWLNPIAKIKDPGTVRSIVETDGKNPSLLVQYKSGGVTPGDAYLYLLDDNNRPTAFKMWVSIIPIGGIKATFDGWQNINGAWFSTDHKLGPLSIPITNLKAGNSFKDLGFEVNPFTFVSFEN